MPALIDSRADEGEETNSSDKQPATLAAIGTRAFSFSNQLVHVARDCMYVSFVSCVWLTYIAGCTALIDPEYSQRAGLPLH